jgi:hypothetical protein
VISRPCKACGVELVFAEGPSGATLPLQRVRTVYIVSLDGKARAVPPDVIGRDRYISHFETCTKPGAFSRKAKPAP